MVEGRDQGPRVCRVFIQLAEWTVFTETAPDAPVDVIGICDVAARSHTASRLSAVKIDRVRSRQGAVALQGGIH